MNSSSFASNFLSPDCSEKVLVYITNLKEVKKGQCPLSMFELHMMCVYLAVKFCGMYWKKEVYLSVDSESDVLLSLREE